MELARRPTVTAIAATLAVLLVGCGQSPPKGHGSTSPGHNCHPSPPDVLDQQDVPFGGGGPTPSTAEREAENKYLYAHWGVATDGIFGDGHFYMGFTDDAQKHLAELRQSVPDPAHVRAYCAPYSKASLGTTMDSLQRDFSTLHGQGIDLTSWGEDGIDGHIDITVKRLTPDIEKQLRARYGAIVGTVQQGSGGIG